MLWTGLAELTTLPSMTWLKTVDESAADARNRKALTHERTLRRACILVRP